MLGGRMDTSGWLVSQQKKYFNFLVSRNFHLIYSIMTCKNNKSPQNGPLAKLISCIDHLGNLLKSLSEDLPLDPLQSESHYSFGLEMELVEEEGVWFAFNQNLEVCCETDRIPMGGSIVF